MSIALCVVVGIVVVVVRKVSVLGHVGHVRLRLLEDRFQRHSVHSRLLRRHGLGTILQNFFCRNFRDGKLLFQFMGGSPGQVVMGGDSCPEGRG